ncbi:hematopoietic prostaglandin D synthase-like [Eriocheir sinensis]|uniref:hematopoietic prostaglandin D synthase-like n=1 Tax=Eriocheir sinensis TaxID=95602 RepID=UPI0021C8FE64|nr:hematopoietic prostaglandin D synthase-like [Eriocheir sinensis]XP_050728155.1 hematopoietic prostaglandin D synthase-like [Eriocheir sinensis]
MPEYKLIYFNARGRAELTRWIFAYGDIAYTDERFEMSDWPAKKQTVPGGRVPVLMVDGQSILQSLTIARYAARQAGLVPQDSLEAARCDEVVDTVSEIMSEVYQHFFKNPEGMQKTFKEDITPKLITPFLTRLEPQLQGKEWLTSGKVTWGDLALGLTMSGLKKFDEEVLKKYPSVEALVERVVALPKIKEWNDKQSQLPF